MSLKEAKSQWYSIPPLNAIYPQCSFRGHEEHRIHFQCYVWIYHTIASGCFSLLSEASKKMWLPGISLSLLLKLCCVWTRHSDSWVKPCMSHHKMFWMLIGILSMFIEEDTIRDCILSEKIDHGKFLKTCIWLEVCLYLSGFLLGLLHFPQFLSFLLPCFSLSILLCLWATKHCAYQNSLLSQNTTQNPKPNKSS